MATAPTSASVSTVSDVRPRPARKRAARGRSAPAVEVDVERTKITRLTAEQRREQLLATAARILVARGFDALTMEAVGLESGASKTLGYAYFTNIDGLILSLWTQELSHLYESVVDAAAETDDFRSLFRSTVQAYYDVVDERGVLLSVLQAGITARRIVAREEPETLGFVDWLGMQLAQAYGVDERLARHFAILAASVPSMDATTRAGQPRDRELEQRCLSFIQAGLDAALQD